MGFRFRKSVNLGPLRINLSKSGVGYSVGTKGFRVTKRADGGVQSTASIPGTGISYTQTHSSKRSVKHAPSAAPSGGKSAKKSGGKKPWIIGILAVLVLAGAVSSCGGDGQEEPQDDPPQVEGTLPAEDDAQDAPEAVQEDETAPEDPDPAQEPAGAPESTPEGQAAEEPAPSQETPASEPAAPPETGSEPEPEPAATPEPDPEPSTNGRTVYITETGSKYHYDGNCGNGTYYPTTLDKAQSMGLTPCAKCAGG